MNTCLTCGKEVKNKYCDVSCQNIDQNKLKSEKRYGFFKNFNVLCVTCGSSFTVNERENLHPKKQKYYCSRSCANKRCHTDETKKKIANGLVDFYQNDSIKIQQDTTKHKTRIKQLVHINCEICGVSFKRRSRKQRFCGKLCSSKHGRSHINCRKAGLASVSSQNRRSKNEKYFYELCENYFQNVQANKPMFNG